MFEKTGIKRKLNQGRAELSNLLISLKGKQWVEEAYLETTINWQWATASSAKSADNSAKPKVNRVKIYKHLYSHRKHYHMSES